MSDIIIRVNNAYSDEETEKYIVTGVAYCSPFSSEISWVTSLDWTTLAATANSAIKDAAISAAADAGFTVGALDKKTLYGAAVGL